MNKCLFVILLLSIIGCSKDSDPTPANNTVLTPTSAAYAYFIGKIDEKSINYEAFISADTKYVGSYGSSGGLSINPNINYLGGIRTISPENTELIDIDFMNFMTGVDGITASTHEKEFFDKLFKVGNYNFVSTGAENTTVLGVGVNYQKDGNYYSSNGSQLTSSYFKILSVSKSEFQEGGNGHKTITITGVFSCRLYDPIDDKKYVDIKDMSFKIQIMSNKPLI